MVEYFCLNNDGHDGRGRMAMYPVLVNDTPVPGLHECGVCGLRIEVAERVRLEIAKRDTLLRECLISLSSAELHLNDHLEFYTKNREDMVSQRDEYAALITKLEARLK